MLLYFSFVFFGNLFAFLARKKKSKVLLFVTALLFAVLVGFRAPNVGIDTATYYRLFTNPDDYGVYFGSGRDLLFVELSKLLLIFLCKPEFLILFYSGITIFLIVYRLWDFRDKASFSLSILFFALMYLPSTMNGMRQWLAVAIVFWSTRFLFKNKILLFFVCVILASLIHLSALISIVMIGLYALFVVKGKKKAKTLIISITLLIPAVIFLGSRVLETYSSYLTSPRIDFGFMGIYKVFLIVAYLYMYSLNKKTYSKALIGSDRLMLFILLNCIVYILFSFLSYFFKFVGRVADYFLLFEILFYSHICSKYKEKSIYFIIIFVMLIYLTYNLVAFDGHSIFPYEFFC